MPLTLFLEQIDSDLDKMRELYDKRVQEIEYCLSEQKGLCEALAEPIRELSMDPPLPTELEMREFELYLVDLKSEKLRRQNEIENLKQEIGALYGELEETCSESIHTT